MDILEKALQEWSYRTKKGYPDLNNDEDLKIFESLFGFNLNEEISRKNSIAAAQDFVDSSTAKTNKILKFKSGKYANRLSSPEIKDLNQIGQLLASHFNLSTEDVILHQKGEGLAANDSVPGFQLNTKKFGEVYISISTGKKGTGGLKSEKALANGINNITQSQGKITVKFTDGSREYVVKGVASAKQVGSRQATEGAKADVSLYSELDGGGNTLANVSIKEDSRTFRWASVNNDKTPFRKAFVEKALTDKSFPVELRRTGHNLDTDKSPKYHMFKRNTDERISMVVVEDAPSDANEYYLFGTDVPKTIITTRSFTEDDFNFDSDTGVLTVKCTALYTDIKQIQGTEIEPAFAVTQHQKQPYGLDFRIIPEVMGKYGPAAKGLTIKYSDVF